MVGHPPPRPPRRAAPHPPRPAPPAPPVHPGTAVTTTPAPAAGRAVDRVTDRATGRGAGDQSGGIHARLPGADTVHAFIDSLPLDPTLRAVLTSMSDSGGFPLLLLVLLLLFIATQDRLDRRDPKLALAPLRREDDIDFEPDRYVEFDGEFDDGPGAGPPAPAGARHDRRRRPHQPRTTTAPGTTRATQDTQDTPPREPRGRS